MPFGSSAKPHRGQWLLSRPPTIFFFMLMLGAATAHGQSLNSQGRAAAQSLVIGLLSGKTDYRDITLATPEGMFRVYSQGNSKPFEMIDGNPDRLVISFKSHAPANIDLGRPQRIIYQFFKTERSLISAIILDEVDYAIFESEASVAEIERSTRKYRLLPRPANPNSVEMICYNASHPILRDRTVRQALAYTIRRNEIKRRFSATRADVAKGPFSKDSQFFPPDINEYSYNPKKAIELLGIVGWRDSNYDQILDRDGSPLHFRLYYDQSTQIKDQIIRQIKINWNEIGIDVKPEPLSAAEINDRLSSGNFDAVLVSHVFQETLSSLEEFFNSGFLNYDSHRLQQAFNNAKRFQGTPTFRAYMQRLQIIINEDQPVNFLYHPWVIWHVINYAKFENSIDRDGNPKLFQEWELRIRP